MVATAIKTEITRQMYLITKTRHDILKLPINFEKKGVSLISQVEDMKRTIFADCEYKEVHNDAEVQGNLSLEQLEDLKKHLLDYEEKIAAIEKTITDLENTLYWVECAAKKADSVFDKEMRVPSSDSLVKFPTFEDEDTEELIWKNTEIF
jgi:hypothetical protein